MWFGRVLVFLWSLTFALGLVACGGADDVDGAGKQQPMFKGTLSADQVNLVLKKGAEINARELQTEDAATSTGVLWSQRNMPKAGSRVTVYRFYNTQTAAHFYTTSETERAHVIANLKQFSYEGPAFYGSATSGSGLSPVYRFFNTQTGVHFYTISAEEKAHIELNLKQFSYEGIAYYASKTSGEGLVGLFRFYVPSKGFHFYTANEDERNTVRDTNASYRYEGAGYFVFGSALAPVTLNTMTGTVRENLLVVSRAGTIDGNTVEPSPDGGLVISSSDAALSTASVGQLAHVPAATGGLELPFTGRISSVATLGGKRQVHLDPVNLEDVFEKMSWDVDTRRSGTKLAGFISAPGVRSSFRLTPSRHQPGLAKALAAQDGSLSGDVQLALEFETEDNGITRTVTLTGEINLNELSMRTRGEFDPLKYLSFKGWGHLSAVMSGSVGGKVSLAGEVEVASLAALIPTLSAWDRLKWKAGKYFSLEGLDDSDKQGKVPLGGLVLSPVLNTAFVGNAIPGSTLSALSAGPSVVLWLYFDASGNVTVEGEAGWQAEGYSFEQGYEFTLLGPLLVAKSIDIERARGTQSLFASGKIHAQQRLGLSLSGDFLLAGIRPVNLNAFVGVESTSETDGQGVYQIAPTTQLTGSLCSYHTLWSGVDLDAAFRVKADFSRALPFRRVEKGLTVEANYSKKLTWLDGDIGACVTGGPFGLSASLRGPDATQPGNARVDLDFSEAYNNASVRMLTDVWRITASCSGCANRVFDLPASNAGLAVISLPTGGSYTLTLEAINTRREVVRSASTVLSVGSAPTTNFAVSANAGNCANLSLDATAEASSGRSITAYTWLVQRSGAVAQNYTGRTVSNVVLPNCGATLIQLTVVDSLGFSSMSSRTVDTANLAARVTDLTPVTALLNQPTAFTVTGVNLPSTSVLSITDAECQTPVNRTSAGFRQTCTPRGLSGAKTVTVKTNTDAAGGGVIDASRQVQVTLPAGYGLVLTQPDNWRLRIELARSSSGTVLPGRLEFQSLQCGGSYTPVGTNAAGDIVLLENIEYGECIQACQILLKPDFSSYQETCGTNGSIAGGGVLQTTEEAWRL